ncbi:MAG: hypothetical protein EXS36_06590 [Pedosphaera sp.]|nr:hypothetical protein [Pedosphaera sp.]
MSRFGNLEFESAPERSVSLRQHLHPLSDETRCLTEARSAFGTAEFESALRWYGRVLEFNPISLEAWSGQVKALIELGQYRDAKVWADKALEKFPQAPDLLAAKAVSLGRLGETDAALAFSDAALERPGDSSYVWLARGDVLLARRERQVEPCFDRALQLAPGDWMVRWLVARVRAYWKQFAAALKLAQEAAALAPDRFVVWVLAGQCQAALGLAAPATGSFHQALALHPGCRPAEEGLTALQSAGLLDRLRTGIRRWIGR